MVVSEGGFSKGIAALPPSTSAVRSALRVVFFVRRKIWKNVDFTSVTGHGEPRSSPLAVRIAPGPGAYRSDGARLWPVPFFMKRGSPAGNPRKDPAGMALSPLGRGKEHFCFQKIPEICARVPLWAAILVRIPGFFIS